MAFKFPLAALLRYRKNLERREYLLLEKLQLQVAAVRNEIEAVQQQQASDASARDEHLAHGLLAIELQSWAARSAQIEGQLQALNRRLRELELSRQQQQETYQATRRQRELLDEMRERQLSAYQVEEARRQQKAIDDLFASRAKRPK